MTLLIYHVFRWGQYIGLSVLSIFLFIAVFILTVKLGKVSLGVLSCIEAPLRMSLQEINKNIEENNIDKAHRDILVLKNALKYLQGSPDDWPTFSQQIMQSHIDVEKGTNDNAGEDRK